MQRIFLSLRFSKILEFKEFSSFPPPPQPSSRLRPNCKIAAPPTSTVFGMNLPFAERQVDGMRAYILPWHCAALHDNNVRCLVVSDDQCSTIRNFFFVGNSPSCSQCLASADPSADPLLLSFNKGPFHHFCFPSSARLVAFKAHPHILKFFQISSEFVEICVRSHPLNIYLYLYLYPYLYLYL